jgi:hypothetical protein
VSKKKNRQKRTFKLKRYPSVERDGITHVYPPAGAQVSRIVERDRMYFVTHPCARSYIRPYVPGELGDMQLPDGMSLADIAYISVIRLGDTGQARIPLTEEQARKRRAQ